ncbi:hypothetical protein VPDG_00072 [Vibrio phage henriette 12B8]|uniref:hypothetical protein n=1 Tax=Vibrio phage henriette 12B8 TaxID=573174 RepID=UPI0002C0C0BF|nr:hypothetical protein VPDG_00072 [Vibrio phage henriette 12B8]AGG58233.1 hypothetical protein VPDG_00072 [Vibrio phage henriette 12B8]
MTIFDQAVIKDGVSYDATGKRIHDWLTTSKPNDDSVILYVPKSQRKKVRLNKKVNGFRAIGSNMKCVSIRELLGQLGFEVTLVNCNHVCYTLDDKRGV